MKVIIVGAGEVGRASAETISNIHDVLVVEKDENVLAGRSRQNKMVHWRPKSLRKPGDIVQVKVDDAHAWTLFGSEI